MGSGAEDIFDYGIESIITTVNNIMPLSDALNHAEELYLGAARRMFRLFKSRNADALTNKLLYFMIFLNELDHLTNGSTLCSAAIRD